MSGFARPSIAVLLDRKAGRAIGQAVGLIRDALRDGPVAIQWFRVRADYDRPVQSAPEGWWGPTLPIRNIIGLDAAIGLQWPFPTAKWEANAALAEYVLYAGTVQPGQPSGLLMFGPGIDESDPQNLLDAALDDSTLWNAIGPRMLLEKHFESTLGFFELHRNFSINSCGLTVRATKVQGWPSTLLLTAGIDMELFL